jgi:hypothetical protein
VIDEDNQESFFLAEDGANRRLTPPYNLNPRVIVDENAIAVLGRDVDARRRGSS